MERSSSGLPRSGGLDFDARLEGLVRESVPGLESLTVDDRSLLRLEVELAKVRLSTADATTIEIPGGREHRITRARFEDEVKGLIEESRIPLERCLRDLGIGPGSIDALVMVGGTCRIPAVRSFVQSIIRVDADPDIDPMTAVGEGAAIAAAILTGEIKSSDFFVALEHSLGTYVVRPETNSLEFSTLIKRGHVLPARATSDFLPVYADQESVQIQVVEGDPESPLPDFTILKEWEVPLDPPTASNPTRAFDLSYEYDIDGILHVMAKDQHTGRVLLEDDVSYGVATDKRQLKTMSDRAKSAVSTGSVDSSAHVKVDDFEAEKLLSQARVKVIPFLDTHEAAPINELVTMLESGDGDKTELKERLRKALAAYSYLL
jgi:molecular chaperone DnaK